MIGQIFGELTVKKETTTQNRHKRYICVCSCGKETITTGTNLRVKRTTSCGHLQHTNRTDNNKEKRQEMQKLKQQGKTYQQIADKYNITRQAVYSFIKK